MKQLFKKILFALHLYYPLHAFYRTTLSNAAKKYYQLAYLKYKGQGFVCNSCGAVYKKFIPEHPQKNIAEAIHQHQVIAGFGSHVYCPNCFCKNRDRLLLAIFKNRIDVLGKRILHFSPEKPLYAYLKPIATVTTADILPHLYKKIDPQIVLANATQLLFESETYDLIIANHILEHIPNDVVAMKELYRVLKKGGLAILQVPYSEVLTTTIETPGINHPAMQEQLYGQRDHVRIYEINDYVHRLQTAGFTVEVIGPKDFDLYKIHAIQANEKVFLCYK